MANSRRHSSWSRKRKFRAKVFVAFLTIVCITAGGIYMLVALKQQAMRESVAKSADKEDRLVAELLADEPSSAQSVNEEPSNIPETASPLERVIYSHFAATKIDEVESLKLKAELQFGQSEDQTKRHEVMLYIRRPNLARRVLMHDGLRLDMGYNGQEFWAQQVGRNGITRNVENISQHQKEQFQEAAQIGSYLWKYESEPEKFTLLEDDIVENIPCHAVAYENDVLRVITYIDTLDFYEIARKEVMKDGTSSIYMSMSDHQKADGVVMPHTIHSMTGGRRFSLVHIQELSINAGVPSYIFDEPEQRYTSK